MKIIRENGFNIPKEGYWLAVEKTSREILLPEWRRNPFRFPIVLLKNLGIEQEGLATKIGNEFSRVYYQYKNKSTYLLPDIKELIPKIAKKEYFCLLLAIRIRVGLESS